MSIKPITLFALAAFASFVSAAELYVSPDGNDSNAGTKKAPFLTLEKARDAARELKTKSKEEIIIRLADGSYPMTKTLELTSADSGTTYQAEHDGKVRLNAGLKVPASAWEKVADAATMKRLAPKAKGKVFKLDLAKLGIKNARPFPAMFADGGGLIELYADGEKQALSRWPNDDDTTMKKVLDKGVWQGKEKRGGSFEYNEDRPSRWLQAAEEGQLWVAGFWRVPWDFEAVKVKSINTAQHVIEMASPVGGGIGNKFAGESGSGKEPWHAINLLEEIDRAGEWSVDFAKQTLYYWPPGALKNTEVRIHDLAGPMIQLKGSSKVTLRGLVLEGGLGNGIEITDGEHCSVASCTLKKLGKHGVVIKDGSHHSVLSCELNTLGHGGIIISGGDRKTLTPCGHVADNNHIHHYALAKINYSPGISVGFYYLSPPAVGCTITHNRIHDSPHAGVLYGGNDNLFEFNEVYNVVNKTDDMGAFYTTHEWISGGNIVRHNFVHHAMHATGYYMDDGDCGDIIEGNVSYQIICGPFIGGGHDNIARNNLSIDCGRGAHVDSRGVPRGYDKDQALFKVLTTVDVKTPPWSTRFPNLINLFGGKPALPTGCIIERTIAVGCESVLHLGGKKSELECVTMRNNEELTMEDMEFEDAAKLNFKMKPTAAAFKKVPGFEPIPFEKIGLYKNELRATIPERAKEFSTLVKPAK
jgi:hypothetical protein